MQDLGKEGDFRDFIQFANARPNFIRSTMSISSFISGRIFDGSGSLEQWVGDSFEASALA